MPYILANKRFPTYRAALIYAALQAQGDLEIATCLAEVICHSGSDGITRRIAVSAAEVSQVCELVLSC